MKSKFSRQKIVTYMSILLDVLGIGILIPAIPELMGYYGLPDYAVTLGIVVYSLFSFLAAPLFGQLSDRYGRRRPLALSITGNVISWTILFIQAPRAYFLSRAVNGITGGNMSILQAILTDFSTTEEERKNNFGLFGAMFGLGFILGPMLGSFLLQSGNPETIFIFGFIFAISNLVMVVTKLKETNMNRSIKKLQINPFKTVRNYLGNRHFTWLLVSFLFVGMGFFSFQPILPILGEEVFHISGAYIGYFLAAAGAIGMVNQVVFVPRFWVKRFTHYQLLRMISSLMIPGAMVMLLSQHFGVRWSFMLGRYSLMPFSSLLQVGYNNEVVRKVPHTQVGEAVGMLGSFQALVMFIGPLFGSLALAQHTPVFIYTILFFAIAYVAIRRYVYIEQYVNEKT